MDELFSLDHDQDAAVNKALRKTLHFLRRKLNDSTEPPKHRLFNGCLQILAEALQRRPEWVISLTSCQRNYGDDLSALDKTHPQLWHAGSKIEPIDILAAAYEWIQPLMVLGYLLEAQPHHFSCPGP